MKKKLLKVKTEETAECKTTALQESDFFIKAKLAMLMQRGHDVNDAAKLAGITQYKVRQFRNDPEFEEFVQKSYVRCKDVHLRNIESAGKQDWRASSWFLERKYPEEFGKKDVIKHEYEYKLKGFMEAVLAVVNEVSPQLKYEIVKRLRAMNTEDAAMDHLKSTQNDIVMIEG